MNDHLHNYVSSSTAIDFSLSFSGLFWTLNGGFKSCDGKVLAALYNPKPAPESLLVSF